MSNAIASTALIISANYSQMTAGLNAASGQITQFAGSAGKGLSSVLQSLSTGIGGGLSSVTGMLSSAGSALSKLGPWGMGAAAGLAILGGVAGPVSFAIDRMASTIKAADTLGVSFGFATVLADKLGGIEAVSKAMLKLDTIVADAGAGNEQAAHKIRALGVSVKELEGLNPEQTFMRMADAVSQITDPASQAAAAHDLFGKKAAELLPMLRKGSAGMQELKDKYEAFGATDFSGNQLAQITAAKMAWKDVSLATTGATNIMGSAFAPLAETIGSLVASMWLAIKPVAQLVGNWLNAAFSLLGLALKPVAFAFKMIGAALDLLLAPLNLLMTISSTIFSFLGNVSSAVGNKISGAVSSVKGVMGSFFGWIGDKAKGAFTWVADTTGLSKVGEKIKGMWKWLDNTTGISTFFGLFKKEAKETEQQIERTRKSLEVQAKVDELVRDLTKANAQFGMTDVEKQIDDLKRLGATENQLQEAMSQMRANQGQQFEFEADPTKKLKQTMANLDDLYAHGALSATAYQMQVDKAMSETEKALGIGTEFKAASAVFAGSSQAIETITRASLEQPDSPQDRANRIAERQLQVQERLLESFTGVRNDLNRPQETI